MLHLIPINQIAKYLNTIGVEDRGPRVVVRIKDLEGLDRALELANGPPLLVVRGRGPLGVACVDGLPPGYASFAHGVFGGLVFLVVHVGLKLRGLIVSLILTRMKLFLLFMFIVLSKQASFDSTPQIVL